MNKRRLIRILALCMCVALFSSALPVLAEESDAEGDTWEPNYVAAMVTDAETEMNILKATNRDVISAEMLVYEALIELDSGNKPTPQLCTDWSTSADGYTWTFKIRTDVTFHDGSPLTANDVSESMRYILQNNYGAWASVLQIVSSCEVIDEYTLNVTSKLPSYMLLYAMTFPIVPASQVNSPVPAGTGPYRLLRLAAGSEIRLSANQNWWKRTATVENVHIANFFSFEDALSALEGGSIDAVSTRSLQAGRFRSMSNYFTFDYNTRQFECIVPNLENSYTRDLNVRRAIMCALDRQSIINNVYLSMATEAEVAIPPGDWLYDSSSEIYSYDKQTAQQYLISSGWADSDGDGYMDRLNSDGEYEILTLNMITYEEPDYPARQDAATMIANQISAIGIKVKLEVLAYDAAKKRLNEGEYDLAVVAYYMNALPDLVWLYGSEGSGNISGYSNPEMDGYLATTQLTTNESQFLNAMKQVQQIAAAELPIIGLYFRNGTMISSKQLLNMGYISDINAYNGLEYANYMGQ